MFLKLSYYSISSASWIFLIKLLILINLWKTNDKLLVKNWQSWIGTQLLWQNVYIDSALLEFVVVIMVLNKAYLGQIVALRVMSPVLWEFHGLQFKMFGTGIYRKETLLCSKALSEVGWLQLLIIASSLIKINIVLLKKM